MRDIIETAGEYAAARSVCGERNKGDVLIDSLSAELLSTRDLLQRLARGPDHLSQAERESLSIEDPEQAPGL